jgi:tetratricopeptide (TPR) repeat protein
MFLASIAFLLTASDPCTERLSAARAALQQRNPAEASSILSANREACSTTSFYFELLGTTSGLLGRRTDAEEAFRKAVSMEPKNSRLHFELGATYFEAGKPLDAVREFKLGLQIEPSNTRASYYLIGIYASLKDWQNASRAFDSLGAFTHPHLLKDPAIVMLFARVLAETGKTAQIDSLLSPDGSEMTPALLFSLGALFAERKLYSQVVRFLSHIPDQDADDAVCFNLAQAYSHMDDFEKARAQYFHAIDKNPGHVEAYFHVGLDYGSSGQQTKAVPWLAQAHKLAPSRVDILFALAEHLIRLGYFGSADSLLKTAVEGNDDPLLLVAAGDLKAAEAQSDEAVRLYQEALVKKPGLVDALVSLADVQIEQEKYAEARKSLDLALKASPDNPAVEGSLGLLEYKTGAWQLASVHLARAWKRSQANAQVGLYLARSLRHNGELENSRELLLSLKLRLNDMPAYHLELAQIFTQLHQSADSAVEQDVFQSLEKAHESSVRFDKPQTYVF